VNRSNLTAVCVTIACAFSMWATPAFAYVGPGAGLSAIGAFLALILGVILAFFGFIWYPVKRFLRKGKAAGVSPSEPLQKPQGKSVEEGA
jgi:flagellar biogenesis protein FliO